MYRQKLSPLKIVVRAAFAAGAIAFACVLVLMLFSDSLVNRFIKPVITKAFVEANPAYSILIADMHYSVLKNRIGFDSVAVSSNDSTLSGSVGPFSVSGIHWMHLLWGGKLGTEDFADVDLDVQDIELNFPQSSYEFRCERLRVSVPDSEMVAESVELYPLGGDEKFFGESKFRKTRMRLVVPQYKVMGLAWLELLQGVSYRARSIQFHDAFLDILVNKDKPNSKEKSSPFMPNEMLVSIKETLQVGSVNIVNGRLKYSETFPGGTRPSWITFDSLQMSAEGITNRGDRSAAVVIHVQTKFANAGTMIVLMSVPVASPELSLHYTGSLSGMDLRALNSFLEPAENMRIKSGDLEEVTFEVSFASGHARGNVRGVYRKLVIAAIDKQTGSEKGFSDRLTSFIANTFKIHGTNVPNKSGSMKIGEVKYTRERDDSFIQVVWFSLRTGVRDVVGF